MEAVLVVFVRVEGAPGDAFCGIFHHCEIHTSRLEKAKSIAEEVNEQLPDSFKAKMQSELERHVVPTKWNNGLKVAKKIKKAVGHGMTGIEQNSYNLFMKKCIHQSFCTACAQKM